MAEGNPTEFLIENDEKFIGEFILKPCLYTFL